MMAELAKEMGETSSARPLTTTMVELKMQDVHDTSMAIVEGIVLSKVNPHVAAASLALTMGRMASPKILSPTEEIAFVRGLMEYIVLWFGGGEGKVN